MRGSRAKALRTEERPNPGRKHGGSMKDQTPATDHRSALASMFRKFLPKTRLPSHPSQHTKNLMTSKHGKEWAKHTTLHRRGRR
jgi:hypothetical protein